MGMKTAIPRVPEVEHVKKTTNGKRSTFHAPGLAHWLTKPVHGYVTHCPQGGKLRLILPFLNGIKPTGFPWGIVTYNKMWYNYSAVVAGFRLLRWCFPHLFSRVQRVRARWLSRGFLQAMLLPTLSFATSAGLSSAKFKKFRLPWTAAVHELSHFPII